MLRDDIGQVGWPGCGEIDIMENIGKEPGRVHGTVHGPNYSGANGITSAYDLTSGALADTFHVVAIEWQPDSLKWCVDCTLSHTGTPRHLPGRRAYDHPL